MARDLPTVGIVGNGRMGLAAVARLAGNGFLIHAYDRDPDALESAVRCGARPGESPGQLAALCGVMLLSLPSDSAVREVVQGPDGLLSARSRVKAIFDLSTVSPAVTRDNAERCMEAGIRYHDAPVVGGTANCGDWTILVGESEDEIGPEAPVLDTLGRPHYLGRLGAGNSLKLINNMMLAVLVSTIREMLMLSRATGIAPEVMWRVLSGTGSVTLSRFFTEVLPRVLEGDEAGNFSIGMLQKDAGLALQLARTLEIETPTLEAASQAIAAAGADLDPNADFTEILRRAASAPPR